MEISNVRVAKVESANGKLVAYADCVVNNCIAIHNIKVIKGSENYFIAFPNSRRLNKETGQYIFSDIVHPINSETRKAFEDAILSEFSKLAD